MEHEIGDTHERIAFMREHLRAAAAELASAQARVAAAVTAASDERDAHCLVAAAVSRLDADDAALCAEGDALAARALSLERALGNGEAKLAAFSDAFQWSAQQLASWAAAAAQQDEDALALEAYQRADEARGRALRAAGCNCGAAPKP